MKISTKILAQFFFNVLGFTKEQIKEMLIKELEQEVRKQVHRVLQKSDVDERVKHRVDSILYNWDTERKVCDALARIVKNQIQINITDKQTNEQ